MYSRPDGEEATAVSGGRRLTATAVSGGRRLTTGTTAFGDGEEAAEVSANSPRDGGLAAARPRGGRVTATLSAGISPVPVPLSGTLHKLSPCHWGPVPLSGKQHASAPLSRDPSSRQAWEPPEVLDLEASPRALPLHAAAVAGSWKGSREPPGATGTKSRHLPCVSCTRTDGRRPLGANSSAGARAAPGARTCCRCCARHGRALLHSTTAAAAATAAPCSGFTAWPSDAT